MVKVNVAQNLDFTVIEQSLNAAYRRALEIAVLELLDYLEGVSPRGVSQESESLRGNWTFAIQRTRGAFLADAIIQNDADNSLFRVIGRGPGKMPPHRQGSDLERWATAKGLPAFLVAKTIAQKGTQRWRDNDNILGIDSKTGTLARDSPVYTVFFPALQREWNAVKVQ